MPLLQSPEAAPLAGFGTESHVDRRSTFTSGAPQMVNFPTVRWTVGKEGTPCKRGRSLKTCCSYIKRQGEFFPAFSVTEILFSPQKTKTGSFRGRSLLQSVPSFKTVHWTVLKFTPCRAPEVNVDLRSTWDSVPNPARGAASGLCQRDIVPLETRFYRLRRSGTSSQTLHQPFALPRNAAPIIPASLPRLAITIFVFFSEFLV